MEHIIKIPKNHPESEQLEKVINSLLEFLPLHSIYVSLATQGFIPKSIVTILLSKECQMDASDVKPFVERLFRSYPKFRFTLFEQWWAAEMWEEGNPFLILNAKDDQLAYISTERDKIFAIKRSKIKEQIRGAEEYYNLLSAWAENAFSYVTWYKRHEDYLQAAFHLHQALKHKFQIASWLYMGEYLASESLVEQQRYIIDFEPELGKLFDRENNDEKKAIKELDNSCRQVRHNYKNYTFTKEAIELAIPKAEEISAQVHTLFKILIARCKVNLVS